jgi:hypothetical protein
LLPVESTDATAAEPYVSLELVVTPDAGSVARRRAGVTNAPFRVITPQTTYPSNGGV